jgi:site-specific DNA-methyltransferase (adenine-specific)
LAGGERVAEPYYADDQVVLYQGDALAVLRALPDDSVHAVVTDPPYSSGGQYRGDRTAPVHAKYVQTDSVVGRAYAPFAGDNRDQRGYGYWCALWLGELLRVVRPGGACVLFTDWRQLPTTTDVLQVGGWVWRGIVPWHKPNGRNVSGRFANKCEYVVWGTKGPRPVDASDTLPGFFQVNVSHDRDHITQKPVGVLRELVRVTKPGETVLDPFMGSGTTGVACVAERRRFVGVELDPGHAATARRRISVAAFNAAPASGQDDLFTTAAVSP